MKHGRNDDQRSSHYDDLLSAENRAIKNKKGVHGKKETSMHRVADVSGVREGEKGRGREGERRRGGREEGREVGGGREGGREKKHRDIQLYMCGYIQYCMYEGGPPTLI